MSEATTTAPTEGEQTQAPAKPPAPTDNQIANIPNAIGENWWDDSQKFALIQRAARMFASSPLVPDTYRGADGIGSCVIAFNMAHRMNADPLMVMQNLYIVHGRPAWSAQFLIACFNQTRRFSPIRYEMSGKEGDDSWGCTAWSTDRETGEKIQGPLITIKTAKDEGWYQKKGSKWQTIPRLMLMYRAASWLVRTHAPELAMGLQTAEEVHDTHDQVQIAPADRLIETTAAGGSRSERMAERMNAAGNAAQAAAETKPVTQTNEPAEDRRKTTPTGRAQSLLTYDDLFDRFENVRDFNTLDDLFELVKETKLSDEERDRLVNLGEKMRRQMQNRGE